MTHEANEDIVAPFLEQLTEIGKTVSGLSVRVGALALEGKPEAFFKRDWEPLTPNMRGCLLVTRTTSGPGDSNYRVISGLHVPGNCRVRCTRLLPWGGVEPTPPCEIDRPIFQGPAQLSEERLLQNLAVQSEVLSTNPQLLVDAFIALRGTGHSLLPLSYEFPPDRLQIAPTHQ